MNELSIPSHLCKMDFPDPDNLMAFVLIVGPDEASLLAIENIFTITYSLLLGPHIEDMMGL